MKRLSKFFLITTAFAFVLMTKKSAWADPLLTSPGLAKSNDINEEINIIIQYVLGGAFTLAVLALLVGGFLYVTAADDSKRVDQAKSILKTAIIGLIVILLAFTIASTVNFLLVTR